MSGFERLSLYVEVPLDWARQIQARYDDPAAFRRESLMRSSVRDAVADRAIAAILEMDLPPEQIPVTPETKPGTEIRHRALVGDRTYVGPMPDGRIAACGPDGSFLIGYNADGWFEVQS